MRVTVSCVLALVVVVWMSVSAEPGSIFVMNNGTYGAQLEVDFILNGSNKVNVQKRFKGGENVTVHLPDGAESIKMRAKQDFLWGTLLIFQRRFPKPPENCYAIWGVTFNARHGQFNCTE